MDLKKNIEKGAENSDRSEAYTVMPFIELSRNETGECNMKEFIEKLIGRLEEKENEAVLKAPNTSDISNIEYQKWMMKSYGFKESIEATLETSITIDNEHKIGCSIGITTCAAFLSVHELDDMIKVADDSLYNVKAAGKGTYIFA